MMRDESVKTLVANRLAAAAGLALGALAIFTAGCASGTGGGTAALPSSSTGVQGRDLGRGGATAGGLSSLDPSGNAADWSVYDAREAER